MDDRELFIHLINNNLGEINDIIDSLYTTPYSCTRNKLLNRLRKQVSNISLLIRSLQSRTAANSQAVDEVRVFTPEELSQYNGKGGNPAYVAVNGVVYDVTDSAAWAGAIHFGIPAGTDASNVFAACHPGQQVLSRLKAVGKMAK